MHLKKNLMHVIIGCMDGEMKEGKPIDREPVTTPTFRQLADTVYDDQKLADPFLDGVDDESDNTTVDRDALKVMLVKHYGYSPDEVEEVDHETCRFTGRDKQSIALRSGHDDKGDSYLEFSVEQVGSDTSLEDSTEPIRIVSPSLKIGVPLAIALAHQPPDKLSNILDDRNSDPVAINVGQLRVSYETQAMHNITTKTWSLKANSFRESDRWVGGTPA